MTCPLASVNDTALNQDRSDSALPQDQNSVFLCYSQSDTDVTLSEDSKERMSEPVEQEKEMLSSQTHVCAPQQTRSSSPAMESCGTTLRCQSSNTVSFDVTPSMDCGSDTDVYMEEEYKPVIEGLASETMQTSFIAEKEEEHTSKECSKKLGQSAENNVVVKEEWLSDDSSGSDYRPSLHGKASAAGKNIPQRVRPVRQAAPSSFVEDENDNDSVPYKLRRRKKVSGNLEKPTSLRRNKKEKNKTSRSSTSSSSSTQLQASSKGPGAKTCPLCHKTFSRTDSLTVHMRVHTGDRPFHCQECDATYKVSSHLRNHIRSKHSNTKAYKCDSCSKAFFTPDAKHRHEKNCGTGLSERVKHQCFRCQKHFVTEEGYEKHKKLDTCTVPVVVTEEGYEKLKKQGTCSVPDCTINVNDNDSMNNTGEQEITAKQEGEAFKCTVCSKAFAESSGLDTHQRFLCGKGPGAGPYTCSECNKVLMRWNQFVAHCRRHTGDKPYVCLHCGSRFFVKNSLTKHVSRHHKEKSINEKEKSINKCSMCEKQFTVRRNLSVHIMRVHCGLKPYKCNECDSDFASVRILSRHIRRVHRKEKQFKCQICGRAFFDSRVWMKHMILHAGNRPPQRGPVHKYPCNLCGKSFNMRLMRMHVEEDHPGVTLGEAVNKTMVTCELCKKEFSDPNSLKMHMKRHSGRRDYKCDKCEMCFVTLCAMQQHQQKHSDDRPYACEECGQTFRWRASLREHKMHSHNPNLDPPDAKGRRLRCEECGQRFKRYESLKDHKMRHSGALPCICSECGKGFANITRLKIHMSCHSGSDRPFICEQCGAGFYYSFLLKAHIQRRHSPSPWLCNYCGRSLCHKDALKHHIQLHANSPDGIIRRAGRGRGRLTLRLSLTKLLDPDESTNSSNPGAPIDPDESKDCLNPRTPIDPNESKGSLNAGTHIDPNESKDSLVPGTPE